MKFLCFGYFDRQRMGACSRAEIDVLMASCGPHLQMLYASGRVLFDVGVTLETCCLQRVGNELKITHATPGFSGDMIGGAFLIEAADMDDAARIASLHPTTQIPDGERFGWRIEIRPVHHYESPAATTTPARR